ncbi:methyl-accepting chemotaxis protein [Paenibacillus glycanilyticus]|uniref:methyl-accepting chemotaxis protein n=1 Tax=Paenibacillus glycanilyticus TaxID=126569 RepID=UPI003EBCBBDC
MTIAVLDRQPQEKQVEAAAPTSTRLLEYVRKAPVIAASCSCKDTIALFKQYPDSECVVIAGEGIEKDKPVGLMMRNQFFMRLSQRFGVDLYYEKPISELMDSSPLIVNQTYSPQQLIDNALKRDDSVLYNCVIVTGEERIVGILTVSDLLRMSRQLQQEAVDGQVKTINSVGSRVKEIDEAVSSVRQSALQGKQISADMVDLTLSGKNQLDKVTAAFGKLAANSMQQEQRMNELQAEAGSISHVSKLIKELAEQSNLLAINASIEAARAGEHGRGFAVVAGEVMKLASETKRSAEAITTLTKTIVAAIEQTASLAREGREEAVVSESCVQEAGSVFSHLFQASANSKNSTEQIGKLSEQAYQQTVHVSKEIDKLLGSYF